MKLPKNILILLGSYLGAIALVCCIARFTVSLDADSVSAGNQMPDGTDVPVDVLVSDTDDIPTVADPDETDASERDEDGEDDEAADGNGVNEESAEAASVYYLRTVASESGTASNTIGVYDADGMLLEVLDTPVFALPSADRERLAVGIEVQGDEALAQILEDLGE